MAEPQRAILTNQLPEAPPEDCQRLYFGAEFCFWRFPSLSQIHEAIDWCRAAGWSLTLTTPVLAESERLQLRSALEQVVSHFDAGDEVLISDWGTLELVRSCAPDVTVVLGRALSGQKRGPRILDMTLSGDELDYFRQGSWYGQSAVKLLTEQGVGRVELDNLLQGLAPLPGGLPGTLHLPYAMVTSSRNCPYRPAGEAGPCPAPCGEVFILQAQDTKVPLLQGGNTQFLENPVLPGDLAALGIDRLVSHQQLPY